MDPTYINLTLIANLFKFILNLLSPRKENAVTESYVLKRIETSRARTGT
jgi:hypothetical protein